jgi:hypothetical protein
LLGILEDLAIGRAPRSRFLLGSLPAPVLHFALVESHGRIVADWTRLAIGPCTVQDILCASLLVDAKNRIVGGSCSSVAAERLGYP